MLSFDFYVNDDLLHCSNTKTICGNGGNGNSLVRGWNRMLGERVGMDLRCAGTGVDGNNIPFPCNLYSAAVVGTGTLALWSDRQ